MGMEEATNQPDSGEQPVHRVRPVRMWDTGARLCWTCRLPVVGRLLLWWRHVG